MKKTTENIIKTIKESKELYLTHAISAKEKLKKRLDYSTAQQVAEETIYIQDMESRAYALILLLEEIEEME